MRFIKLGLISAIVLFAVIMLLSLLFPSTVIVSRAVNINVPKDSIVYLVKDFDGWKIWVDGMQKSSVKIISKTEADLAGTKVLLDTTSNYSIKSSWQNKNSEMASVINLINDSSSKITVVQWQFEQHVKWYPWEKFASMMNDKILGTMMETNLARLKAIAEKTELPVTTEN
ncbi:hypothetical protein GALL_55170 [mine drainage metagenome]|uniref:Polyketide cyclase / dehydrase and lipid transport n=1 Tax=mine drainage metagenome TaxID=410659 RepID=A0A1J5TA21_9ZZZZ